MSTALTILVIWCLISIIFGLIFGRIIWGGENDDIDR